MLGVLMYQGSTFYLDVVISSCFVSLFLACKNLLLGKGFDPGSCAYIATLQMLLQVGVRRDHVLGCINFRDSFFLGFLPF